MTRAGCDRCPGTLTWRRSLWAISYLASLAFVNVVVPIVILKLATRRGVWGVKLLMALPVVVAIPLAARTALFQSEPFVRLIANSMAALPAWNMRPPSAKASSAGAGSGSPFASV